MRAPTFLGAGKGRLRQFDVVACLGEKEGVAKGADTDKYGAYPFWFGLVLIWFGLVWFNLLCFGLVWFVCFVSFLAAENASRHTDIPILTQVRTSYSTSSSLRSTSATGCSTIPCSRPSRSPP
jgi:hypothetical protein